MTRTLNGLLDLCADTGATVLNLCGQLGNLIEFIGRCVWHALIPPYFWRGTVRQIMEIGYYSLPVVGMTTLFTGMVLALQSYTGFTRFNAEGAIAGVVVLSITRELARFWLG